VPAEYQPSVTHSTKAARRYTVAALTAAARAQVYRVSHLRANHQYFMN
jgi:hypothetical protein